MEAAFASYFTPAARKTDAFACFAYCSRHPNDVKGQDEPRLRRGS